jgi:hypothetical protein
VGEGVTKDFRERKKEQRWKPEAVLHLCPSWERLEKGIPAQRPLLPLLKHEKLEIFLKCSEVFYNLMDNK